MLTRRQSLLRFVVAVVACVAALLFYSRLKHRAAPVENKIFLNTAFSLPLPPAPAIPEEEGEEDFMPPETPMPPLPASSISCSISGEPSLIGTEERTAAAALTRDMVASVNKRAAGGDFCAGVGSSCRRLDHVVQPSGASSDGGCAASEKCSGRGRPPRIYVYDCMDGPHKALLSSAHVTPFFDPNSQRNQYLSEFAFHRSLLLSPSRVAQPEHADFFFVPFYGRLAYADKTATKRIRKMQLNLTASLHECLRASPWWQRGRGRDHVALISSTRNPRKLYGDAWPLLKRSILMRIEAADRRYDNVKRAKQKVMPPWMLANRPSSRNNWVDYARRPMDRGRGLLEMAAPAGDDRGWLGRRLADDHGDSSSFSPSAPLVVPYYVPHFPGDDKITPSTKKHSICFFGSATNGIRKRAIAALESTPDAVLTLATFAAHNGSADARVAERRRTLLTRHRLRKCKLCLVPAGMTPSSRRFYEALVAKCVPLLIADKFQPAFTRLLPYQSFTVRAEQNFPERLPAIVNEALRKWPALYKGVEAARAAFIFGLGQGQGGGKCDATQALLAELRTRFSSRVMRKGEREACLARESWCPQS